MNTNQSEPKIDVVGRTAFEDAMRRLQSDEGFRSQVASHPDTALAEYDLSEEERSQLLQQAGTTGAQGSGA